METTFYSTAESISPTKERSKQAIDLQNTFIKKVYIPAACSEEIGMTLQQADDLYIRLFGGVGDIYRQTDIDPGFFHERLVNIFKELIVHVCNIKWFESKKAGMDIGWDPVIAMIRDVEQKPKTDVDLMQQVAFHTVYFPDVQQEGVADGKSGKRIRLVVHLSSNREIQQTVEIVVNLSDLADCCRYEVADVLRR